MLFFYSLALFAVVVLGSPWWLLRMATSGKYREGLTERLGLVPHRVVDVLPAHGEVVWLHAVSVGEVLAVSPLIQRLRSEGLTVLISTTTRTGQRLARERFGAGNVFYFPLDFAWIVRRYLRELRPRILILAETEFWPNLLAACGRASVPVVVVNGRISDRSFPRYRRLKWMWGRVLAGLSLVLAQSEQDVDRLKAIGAPADRVRLGGNMKFDVRAADEGAEIVRLLRLLLPGDARLLVCGSTLEGEEQMLLDAWPSLVRAEPRLRMVLAPRHPERFPAVGQLLERSGIEWARRSLFVAGWNSNLKPGSVLLLNSIGELAPVYSLAQIAFVGGSLVAAGGHNPLEPAQFGVPIVMGPNYENFRAIIEELRLSNAIRIVSPADLSSTIAEMLHNPEQAWAMGERALEVFRAEAGATDRAAEAIVKILGTKIVGRSGV
jgi:3-deoxy-D-manno-octulosonic-acid transferase